MNNQTKKILLSLCSSFFFLYPETPEITVQVPLYLKELTRRGVHFKNSKVQKSDIRGAFLEKIVFDETDFEDSDFSKIKTDQVVFRKCQFRGVRFDRAVLKRTTFVQTQFSQGQLKKVVCISCRFVDVNMDPDDEKYMKSQGAEFLP